MNDDLDAVGTDAPNSIAPSQNAEDEAKQFELAKFKEQNDHSRRLVAADLGIIGKIFGSKKNAARVRTR